MKRKTVCILLFTLFVFCSKLSVAQIKPYPKKYSAKADSTRIADSLAKIQKQNDEANKQELTFLRNAAQQTQQDAEIFNAQIKHSAEEGSSTFNQMSETEKDWRKKSDNVASSYFSSAEQYYQTAKNLEKESNDLMEKQKQLFSKIKYTSSIAAAKSIKNEMEQNTATLRSNSHEIESLTQNLRSQKISQQDGLAAIIEKEKVDAKKVNGIQLTYGKFFDDFSDNKNNWTAVSDDNKTMSLINGKFKIKGINSKYTYISNQQLGINLNENFSCSVATKWSEGVTNMGFGLNFCSNPSTKSYYVFFISANGYYCIKYYENDGEWKNIKDWKQSYYVNQNSVPNILLIKKEGSYIKFYINDTQVESYPFDGGYGNYFGIRVSAAQTVEFDNFAITGTNK
jgi:hypothetical protein